jgi:VanZ family protein
MLKNKQIKLIRIALYGWLLLIWIVSSLPAEKLPNIDALNLDKLAHISVYFIFSVLLFVNYKHNKTSKISKYQLLLIAIVLAALDEAHQELVVNRTVSLYDLSANITGVLLGYLVVMRKNK